MGKKNKKAKSAVAESDTGMPRHVRREVLEIVNYLLEKCSVPFGSQSTEWNDFLDVYKLVERLRKKQQHYVMPLPSRESHIAEFVKWLTDNGVDTSSVTVERFGDEGYGLKANRDIEESELFLSVPRQLMMTTETAKASVLGPLMKDDRILQSMPNVSMALHVLCELANPESFYQPYIKILPDTYTTPLYFTPDELQLLKGSPAISEIVNQFRNITRQYSYFFRLFQGHTDGAKIPIKNFCFDDYRWAVSTVMTRQNQIPSPGGAGSNGAGGNGAGDESDQSTLPTDTALIPLWDMCNHTSGWITTNYNDAKQCSECFAMHRFPAGSQILIFYGPRSNSELLLHNGFVSDGNQNDRLVLRMGVSKNDPLYAMKAEVLARVSLNTNRIFHLYCDPEQPIDSDLLAYLRVFSMGQDTLLRYLMGDGCIARQQELRNFGRPVSVENETKAWSFLETRAQLLLKAYTTTAEEDVELLSKGGLGAHASLAIQLRLSEKRILQTVARHAALQKSTAEERVAVTASGDSQVASEAASAWREFNVSDVPDATGEQEFVRLDGVQVYGSDSARAAVERGFRESVRRGEYRTDQPATTAEFPTTGEFTESELPTTGNTESRSDAIVDSGITSQPIGDGLASNLNATELVASPTEGLAQEVDAAAELVRDLSVNTTSSATETTSVSPPVDLTVA